MKGLSCRLWLLHTVDVCACLYVQYQLLKEYVDYALERMKLADKFRKYYPGVPRKGHSKEWSDNVISVIALIALRLA